MSPLDESILVSVMDSVGDKNGRVRILLDVSFSLMFWFRLLNYGYQIWSWIRTSQLVNRLVVA